MSWLDRFKPSRITTKNKNQQIPDGLWIKCPGCDHTIYNQDAQRNLMVCPQCGHHMRMSARQRLNSLFDRNSRYAEIGIKIQPRDFLEFKDSKSYAERIEQAVEKTGENDALVVVCAPVFGRKITAAAFEFDYMGGSMGSVVGEKFTLGVEHAIKAKTPFVCFAASGGARMQEGLTSLMQMAKTSAALTQLSKAGLPYISVLTDPTMGGVSASLAMLGDIIIAEPNALIGFAGPRVIEQTVREKLPKGFQRSEFLLEKGSIDCIVERHKMRRKIAKLAALFMNEPEPNLNDYEATFQLALPSPNESLEEEPKLLEPIEEAEVIEEEIAEVKQEEVKEEIAQEVEEPQKIPVKKAAKPKVVVKKKKIKQ